MKRLGMALAVLVVAMTLGAGCKSWFSGPVVTVNDTFAVFPGQTVKMTTTTNSPAYFMNVEMDLTSLVGEPGGIQLKTGKFWLVYGAKVDTNATVMTLMKK